MSSNARALHYVLKVGNLKKNVEFFRDKLLMTVLRHEVFDEGCEAACNGPYDNKWSKTMIGYGPEDDYFVLELTYNYTKKSYKLGNDLKYLKVSLKQDMLEKVKKNFAETRDDLTLSSPDGYQFKVNLSEHDKNDVTEVCLASSDLNRSIKYWTGLLKMSNSGINDTEKSALLHYGKPGTQSSLRLVELTDRLDHAEAFGRIAFSCPSAELKPIQAASETAKAKVLTPFLSLDTPGKATVEVVILADPDDHEICFVGDEGFRELSKVDPEANKLIEQSMADDKSVEWFEKKAKDKSST